MLKDFNFLDIYYINVDSSAWRSKYVHKNLSTIANRLAEYNIDSSITRISATTPDNYIEKYKRFSHLPFDDMNEYVEHAKSMSDHEKKFVMHRRDRNWSRSLGCNFSHLEAIITALENGSKYCLITEDDYSFFNSEINDYCEDMHQNSFDNFIKSLENCPDDFNVLYVSYILPLSPGTTLKKLHYRLDGEFINNDFFQAFSGVLGCGGYIINLQDKEFVNDLIFNLQKGCYIDRLMAFQMQNDYKFLISKHKFGNQHYGLTSDICKRNCTAAEKELRKMSLHSPWNLRSTKSNRKWVTFIDGYEG